MERFNEMRKEWILSIKPLKSLSTQELYFLLEPEDDNKFFESVDSFKDCIEGKKFSEFQILAIEYLLEYKKQNRPKIKTEPYKPDTGTWPFVPLDNDQIQKATKPNTIHTFPKDPFSPFGPVITYSNLPNITYTNDNICSTSIAPDIAQSNPSCRCTGCEFFDGHDMCCHHENFGSITQQSLDNCIKHNLQREKLVQ